jgi:hypothetical protein
LVIKELFVSFKHLVSWNLITDKSDRASDVELQKLAQQLVKPNGEAWEEGELVDIRLAEDLKRRRQQKRSR